MSTAHRPRNPGEDVSVRTAHQRQQNLSVALKISGQIVRDTENVETPAWFDRWFGDWLEITGRAVLDPAIDVETVEITVSDDAGTAHRLTFMQFAAEVAKFTRLPAEPGT